MVVALRPLTPRDLPLLARWADAYDLSSYVSRTRPRNPLADRHDPDRGLFWYVVVDDGDAAGTVWLEPGRRSDEVDLGIYLSDPLRFGRGVGPTAVRLALEECRQRSSVREVVLRVRRNNARAVACYAKLGFAIVSSGVKHPPGRPPVPFYEMRRGIAPLGCDASAPLRERWNHNNHYHPLLLEELGSGLDRVLDVGCGHGFYAAKLAAAAAHVDAVDRDAGVVLEAARLHARANVRFIAGDFLELDLESDSYDAVTSVAALHHMDLRAALLEVKRILRPGGRLVALDLAREESPADYAWSALAFVPDRLQRLAARPRGGRPLTAPIVDPSLSLREVHDVVSEVLPGATVTRRLYWRFLVVWEKPRDSA